MVRWRQERDRDRLLAPDDRGDHPPMSRPIIVGSTHVEADLDDLAARLLAPDGRLAADKVFARRDVIVAAAPLLFGLDVQVSTSLVERVLDHADAVPLAPLGSAREQVWAPKCVVDTELAIQAQARPRPRTRHGCRHRPGPVERAIGQPSGRCSARSRPDNARPCPASAAPAEASMSWSASPAQARRPRSRRFGAPTSTKGCEYWEPPRPVRRLGRSDATAALSRSPWRRSWRGIDAGECAAR